MRKTRFKLFFIWNFDKEERWLNEMAARGFALVSVGFGTYTFESCDAGDYTIRLELLENLPTHPESERYIRFVESTGAEHVGSIFRWVYFRRKKALGAFDLYSDYACRIRHLTRILVLILAVSPLMFMNTFNFLMISSRLFSDPIRLALGLFFLMLFVFCIVGIIRVLRMRRKLQKEHTLYE